MSPRHPSKRSISPQVADNLSVAEWWECERAQARFYDQRAARERALERFCHAAAWCVAALTGALLVVMLVDQLGAR